MKWFNVVIALMFVFSAMAGVVAVAAFNAQSAQASSNNNIPLSGLAPSLVVVNTGNGGEACVAVTTCSTNTIAVVANSVLLIAVTIFGTTLTGEAVAVHGYTPTDLKATASTSPLSQIWGMVITAAATVKPYVNFTASHYYTVEFADFKNTVITTTYVDANPGTTSGSSTAATCSDTTTTANEMVFYEVR